ncbi:MAG TPA: DUF3426 domain-containing protein [Rhizomicrobium sp.]
MILTCPECRTRYQAEAAQFPPEGRKVRCAKCGRAWHEPAPEPESAPEGAPSGKAQPPATAPASGAPAAATPAQRAPARFWAERLGLAAGWAALAIMIFLIGWTLYRFRQEIVTLWPQSSSMFATIGVGVNAHGIAINDWSYRRETENGQVVMVVTGKLVNTSSHELTVPPVRVALTDGNQRELYHWTFHPPQDTLKPGQSLGFSTRLAGPPPGARQVQLGFVSQE